MLTAATAENLQRKAHWADHVQMHKGKPLFSWLDLSITELCNRSAGHPRACTFCPRIDSAFYPNQRLHMSLDLARNIGNELHEFNYEGAVVLCGFGEPLLHPNIHEVVSAFDGLRVEIVTNGDRLTAALIKELFAVGASYINVSMYDGVHQIAPFKKMFAEAGAREDQYILRDRWYGADDDFGLKLTNRAGVVSIGNQPEVDQHASCYYPAYSLALDWNGDALLCVQDWNKRVRLGNANAQSLWSIWTSSAMHKRRMRLAKGSRADSPCSGCNANGTLHGSAHAEAWK